MQTKNYNSEYLQNTGLFLKNLKEQSYLPFKNLDGLITDLGCGIGIDVINLAKITSNKSKVIGIDNDDTLLGKAIDIMNTNNKIEFILSEVYHTPFENKSISGVRAERLLQHLEEPNKFINEVNRILQVDSPFVIVETDWAGLTFYTEHIITEKIINKYITEKRINNGFASRNLTKYLSENNFKKISSKIYPFIVNTLKEANEYLWLETTLKEIVSKGHIDEQEMTIFINTLKKMDSENYFTCFMNIIIVEGIK